MGRMGVDYLYFVMAERKVAKGKEERVERKTSANYLNKNGKQSLTTPHGVTLDKRGSTASRRSTIRDTVYYDSDDEKDFSNLNLTSGQKFYRAVGHGLHSSQVHTLVIFLVFLDVAFVCTEVVFDQKATNYKKCCFFEPGELDFFE